MRNYNSWGTVSSSAELHMLNRAERTRKRMAKKKTNKVRKTK